ncbi:MAG: DNA-binding domain-containing protein [Myxococcaceae bacterium]|nr:DNA-binding domain-containing protein [Myxococcaceae bacterium]
MTLGQLQHQMWEVLVGGTSIDNAAVLVKAGALTPAERVGVYAEMYWLRLRDVLRDEFPQVRAVLGDEDFDVLAAKYLRAHPSTHPSLNWLGQHLAPFLRARPVEGAPFLADLAALEFARNQVFIAPDSPVVAQAHLSRVTPETAASARFTLTPAVQVLPLAHDVRALFRAQADGSTWRGVDVPSTPTFLVVFRQGFDVFHDVVSPEEAAALRQAMTGATLPELCEAFVAFGEEAPARAFQAIASWVTEGLVARIDV